MTSLTTIHTTSSGVYLPPHRRKIVTADKSYASVVKDITNLQQNRKPTRSSGSAGLGSWPTPSEVLTYQSKRHKGEKQARAVKSQSKRSSSSSAGSWRSSPASSSTSTATASYLAMASVSLSAPPGFPVPQALPLASNEAAESGVLVKEQGSTDEKPHSSQSEHDDAASEEELTDEEQDSYSVECSTSDDDEDESMTESRSLSDAEDAACAPDADGSNVVDEKADTKAPHRQNITNAWRTVAELFNWSPVPEWEVTHAPEPRSDWPAIATFSLFYFDLPAAYTQLWAGDQDDHDMRDGQFDQRSYATIEEWMKDFY